MVRCAPFAQPSSDDGRHPWYSTGRKSLFRRPTNAAERQPPIVQTQRSRAQVSRKAAEPPSRVCAHPVHLPSCPDG